MANTTLPLSPDSPLNVNAFPAPPHIRFPPRHNVSAPSVDILRTPPWPTHTTAPAALRCPEDTMTVIQREEQRAAEDAIIPSSSAAPASLRMSKAEWASPRAQRRSGSLKMVLSQEKRVAKVNLNLIDSRFNSKQGAPTDNN